MDENNIDIKITRSELKSLFDIAIDGLTTGICNINVGKDKKDLCNRFTLRLINILYTSSGMVSEKPLYLERMERDGDLLGAVIARKKLGLNIPKTFLQELQSAIGQQFVCTTGSAKWCTDFRWIRLPDQCPKDCDTQNPQFYSGLDFLLFYSVMNGV